MKPISCIVISLLLLASCSPQRRLNRLIGNHPELAKVHVKDTVLTAIETDTIYIPERSIDTFFTFQTDTFTVTDSGVTVTVIKEVDKWRLKTVVQRDTILYTDTVKIAYKDSVNVFEVKPIKTSEIWRYRKQGALWLLILLIIFYLAQLAVRLYLKGQLPFLKL